MEFRVLGPVEVRVDDEVVPIPAPMQRVLLALLIIHAGEVLSTDRIITELWSDKAPASGANALRFHVSKLRSALTVDPSSIVTQGSGYVLEVDPESIDAVRFERMLGEALGVMGGDPDRADSLIRDALSLWHGDPYAGLGDPGFVDGEARRLNELRMRALEVGFAAGLALGRHEGVVGDLEAVLVEFPFRERLWAHLMVALYRSGRQADALRAFQRASQALGEQLGIEPSQELADLEQRILFHDPTLDFKERFRSNLPSPASSYIGREPETDELVELCSEGRLVTITGVGGVGKTRLAIEVARRCLPGFVDGVFFIDLIELSDPAVVARRFLSVLEVVERSGQRAVETLTEHLSRKHCLLVVDNCEHVVDGVADTLTALVPVCPGVHAIATSRVRLGVAGEELWELSGLRTGKDGETNLRETEASQLFSDRARYVRRDFVITPQNEPVIDRICRSLDGIPLAIELAAARVRVMTTGEIADHLSERFAFLIDTKSARPGRHQTLRSMIDWSYDLLDEPDQRLFRLLGVFRGGFILDALQAMCAESDLDVAQAVERLVDASLVTADMSGPVTRYRLLETVREYATERLDETDETDAARDRHLAYYASMAGTAFERMDTPFSPAPTSHEDSLVWRAAVGSDVANLLQALDRALETDDLVGALAVATPLADCWVLENNFIEATERLEAALNRDDCPESPLQCAALVSLGEALVSLGDNDRAEDVLDRAEEVSHRVDLRFGRARIPTWRGMVPLNRGDVVGAIALLETALEWAEQDDEPRMGLYAWNLAGHALIIGEIDRVIELIVRFDGRWPEDRRRALLVRSLVAAYQGRHQDALELAQEALRLAATPRAASIIRSRIGNAVLNLGELDEAWAINESLDASYRELGLTLEVAAMGISLAHIELRRGNLEEARDRLRGAVVIAQGRGDRYTLWTAFHATAECFSAMGDPESAAILLGHCTALTERHRYAPEALNCTPLVTLETLAKQLDSERLNALAAEGASATTDELAERVLGALAE
ncbi:MAG: BTAD domain-containing putative transcriptional regulator [Actinomycetota bacterium]